MGKYKSYDDWYDNGPGSESFKRSIRSNGTKTLATRNVRYIEEGHGDDSLTQHEKDELVCDFGIDMHNYYILAPLTKAEWDLIIRDRFQKLRIDLNKRGEICLVDF
jgi:hypothetical protein